ncbi:ISMsm4, transposase [Mycolicibacterium thermoresistibile]|nr:ISMsm4, transposase [Mycolicibacterium thermoresistibile]
MPQTSGSLLLGLDGVVVESVHVDLDRTRTIYVRTAEQWVGVCPGCMVRSARSKGWVSTRPRDIKIGPDIPRIVWRKRKWVCANMCCDRKSFTESVPSIPPRARVTVRAKREMASAVLDDDRSVKAVAAAYGCTWNTCHDAVIATADPVLAGEPEAVSVLGIDETRRGKAKWETCSQTGTRSWVDRFDTGLVDITGTGGLLVQVNGRAAKPVTDWLDQRDPGWKATIEFVAIDMSVTYANAARQALPHAKLIVDRFHLVKRANEMVDEVRRRTTQAHRLRRGRKSDPEWINRRRLLRAAERLTDEQRHKLFVKLTSADPNGDIAAAWIAKELLRDVLACTARGGLTYEIRDALYRFYTFCAACSVPEISKLARTISAWQEPMILAIQTGLSNARSEGYNRIIKHVGRIAFGFRNPENQRRRVRWACTRQSRRTPPSTKQVRPC